MNSQQTQSFTNATTTTTNDASLSVYIPCITSPTGHLVDEQYIKYLFESVWSMGEVKRIDIFDVVNSNGKRAGNKRGAFVHMYHWDDSETAIEVNHELNTQGKCQIWLTYDNEYNKGCYWILKKMNREPVPDTILNASQLAEKLREMTLLLKENESELNELRQWKKTVIEGDFWKNTGLDNDITVDKLIDYNIANCNGDDYSKVEPSQMTIDELM